MQVMLLRRWLSSVTRRKYSAVHVPMSFNDCFDVSFLCSPRARRESSQNATSAKRAPSVFQGWCSCRASRPSEDVATCSLTSSFWSNRRTAISESAWLPHPTRRYYVQQAASCYYLSLANSGPSPPLRNLPGFTISFVCIKLFASSCG